MNKFYKVMKEKPDAKLLEIVERKRKDYEPEALEAAETVLLERNISWEVEEGKPEESLADIRAEIQERLAAGENIATIKMDIKDRGIDTFEYAEYDQREEEKENPEFASRRKKITATSTGIILLVIFTIRISRRGVENGGPMIFLAVVGVLLIYLVIVLLRKPKT